MGERIKAVQSPTLTVNSAGTGFDEITNAMWGWDSSTAAVITPVIDGEIYKIAFNFTSSNASAVLTIATRDTPVDTIAEITGWASDVTLYPVMERKTYQNATAAAANKTNVFGRFVAKGSLTVDCSGATDDDTVVIKIYFR